MSVWNKYVLQLGIAAATSLLPSLLVGQQPIAHTGPVPDGWYEYPSDKLKNVDETTLRCFNYSHNEWQDTSKGDSVKITRFTPQKGDKSALPPMLKHEEGMPGRTIRSGLRSATHLNNVRLLAYDAGEWGGGLWLTNEDGSKTKQILSDNVRAVVPIDGGVLVLSGLAHLTMDFGNAFILSNLDGLNLTLQHAVHLDGEPLAAAKEADGSVLIATTYGLCRITKSGELQRLVYFPKWIGQQYANSMAIAANGSIFIGMRMFVLELSASPGGYSEEWLLPNDCRKFDLRKFDCVCKP